MPRKSVMLVIWSIVFFFTAEIHALSQEVNSGFVEKETEAIRCWLKSDKNAVRVAEKFNVTLTCQVIEAESGKAVPLENMLEPAAITFPPYEVVQGTRYQDIRKGSFRFFQYRYELRLIGEEFFGKEVPIPALEIKYKIQRRVNNRESLDAREKIYKLPPLPVKVHSLVSKDTKDIRDASEDNFGVVKTKMFRAYAAFAVAGLLLLVPLAVALVPLIRSIRQFRRERSNGTVFSNAVLLRRVKRELAWAKRTSVRNGWNNELVGRVVTVFRIAGAIALSKQINQLSTRFESKGLEGQLKLRNGLLWPKKVLISSSLTPETMSANKQTLNSAWADEFISVFSLFNDARYSPDEELDKNRLDRALDKSRPLVRRLKFRNNCCVRKLMAVYGKVKGWRPRWRGL